MHKSPTGLEVIKKRGEGQYLEHDSRPRIKSSFDLRNVHGVLLWVGNGIRVRWRAHRAHHRTRSSYGTGRMPNGAYHI